MGIKLSQSVSGTKLLVSWFFDWSGKLSSFSFVLDTNPSLYLVYGLGAKFLLYGVWLGRLGRVSGSLHLG